MRWGISEKDGITMSSQDFLESLNAIIPLHQQASDLHPALKNYYPIAIVVDEQFLIFDFDPSRLCYEFKTITAAPIPVPEGVRAAFQLEAYGGRVACVVTPDVFDTRESSVTILHEFVHCYQYETCEQELMMTLDIARHAREQGDFMWEIQHAFPYTAEDFIKPYTEFLTGLNNNDESLVKASRRALMAYLGVHDYEYMVWQEWKEGFARWVENRIKRHIGCPENKAGLGKPYSRVLFYAGGESFIAYLGKTEPGLTKDLPGLFHRMLNVPSTEDI